MMSGFLLCHRLLTGEVPSLASLVGKRVLRLWPAMLLVSAVGLMVGDCWSDGYNEGQPASLRLGGALLFVNNYLDVATWGSLTMSLSWSNAVELHCSIALVLLVAAVRSSSAGVESWARRLRWILAGAVAAAVAIRAYLFERASLNIFLLGQSSHLGLLQTDSSYRWLADQYTHVWRTSNSAAHIGHVYMNGMYNPTHTRFGPYAAGALLACSLVLATSGSGAAASGAATGEPAGAAPRRASPAALVCTASALANLALPCVPPEDEVPLAAQHFATAALRVLSAASAALLLYRALVPQQHRWASGAARAVLSSRALAAIGRVSYPSYLLHFRLLEFLNFSGALGRPAAASEDAAAWVGYMLRLFVTGAALSLAVAALFQAAVEKPLAAAVRGGRGERREKSA
jgi:peptidoglycan/LPS O-acetylase OafA/YrhL